MNQQMIQAINQIKSIRNPQQAAMQVLQNAARQGNQMAKGMSAKSVLEEYNNKKWEN